MKVQILENLYYVDVEENLSQYDSDSAANLDGSGLYTKAEIDEASFTGSFKFTGKSSKLYLKAGTKGDIIDGIFYGGGRETSLRNPDWYKEYKRVRK
jgi:hypothetical protein